MLRWIVNTRQDSLLFVGDTVTMDKEIILLRRSELKNTLVIDKLIQRQITVAEAAQVLGLSTRLLFRLKSKVMERGSEALAYGNRGRSPSHTISCFVYSLI